MMIDKLISSVFRLTRTGTLSQQLSSTINPIPTFWSPWSLTFVRNRMRYHFSHPNERMRIKKHGWYVRMATLSGRKILMRRILKGKHVLSH